MGSSSSKGRRKVTKVAPVPSKGERLTPPGSVAVYNFPSPLQETSPNRFASQARRNPALERQLPPLRETWHGRYSTELEPFILAKDVSPDKYSSLQGGSATSKAKELEKGRHAAIHPHGRRQYLLQMKMLEIRKEEELKRRLREEARIPKLPTRDARRTLGHRRGNNSSDDEDLLALELNQTFKRTQGDRWSGELFKEPGPSDAWVSRRGKVEAWLLKQQGTRESSSDASSSDSDNWKYPCRRPALVRTKTERITLFDEFFDKEF